MSIEDFLLARLDQAAGAINREIRDEAVRDQLLILITNQKLIVDWHKNWPVLITEDAKWEAEQGFSPDEVMMRMTQRMTWATNEEYKKRFGNQPPTAPLLRQMAAEYSWHPDYEPEWEI